MKIHFIETGLFKLDGGAMFGVVPKRLWSKLNPPDENNLCTWAMRCLLLDNGDRKILVDTGIGDKQDAKFRSFFEPHGEDSLLGSLHKIGLQPGDITDVFLTHLHFDHVGGAVIRNANGELRPAFPNATYWTNRPHFEWAMDPNPREAASFLKENFVPLLDAGVLRFIEPSTEDVEWLPGIRVRFVYGHTEAMMILFIEAEGKTYVYCADVIPSSFHVGMPYIMAYDMRPLETLREKALILEDAAREGHYLIFEHDPLTAFAQVRKDDRGRISVV